jgi:hypothetical protein
MEAGLVNFTYGVNSGSWSTWTIAQESRIYVKCIGDVELNEQYNILCVLSTLSCVLKCMSFSTDMTA